MINDKIHICNWLLTRRCNLSCSYCAISRELENRPKSYPPFSYYLKNEMTTEYIIHTLDLLKLNNPNMFHIFYGGEPFLRKDLFEIINHCNNNDIAYTIISNCSDEIRPKIDDCFSKVKYIQGFTASVDPYYDRENKSDQAVKTVTGKQKLLQYKGIVKDLVAEITVSNENKKYLYDLVCELSEHNISSDITFIDIAKNNYYDFSNVFGKENLVKFDNELLMIFAKLVENKDLKIHMKDSLITEMLKYTDSTFDCKLEQNFHNLCIDADGRIRLCLRIRGEFNPKVQDLMTRDGKILSAGMAGISADKIQHCQGCNWPCVMMSKMISENEKLTKDLIHEEDRKCQLKNI